MSEQPPSSPPDSQQVHVIIADDHELLRRGLRATLETVPGWSVIAEATNGREAVELAARLRPELWILDVSMPELNGLEATRQILLADPQARILILTMHESEQIVREVLAAGAQGYMLKSDAGLSLVQAVEALLEDRPYFTSKVARLVLGGYLKNQETAMPAGEAAALSSREREIVQLLAEGKSNKEVAQRLGISVKTAETHRNNIMRKMKFHSITDMVRFAIRNNMIEP